MNVTPANHCCKAAEISNLFDYNKIGGGYSAYFSVKKFPHHILEKMFTEGFAKVWYEPYSTEGGLLKERPLFYTFTGREQETIYPLLLKIGFTPAYEQDQGPYQTYSLILWAGDGKVVRESMKRLMEKHGFTLKWFKENHDAKKTTP